jgi:hypothetical protein
MTAQPYNFSFTLSRYLQKICPNCEDFEAEVTLDITTSRYIMAKHNNISYLYFIQESEYIYKIFESVHDVILIHDFKSVGC